MNAKQINLKCLDLARRLLPEPIQPYQRAYVPLPEKIKPVSLIDDSSIDIDHFETVDVIHLEFIVASYCIGSVCELEWELVL